MTTLTDIQKSEITAFQDIIYDTIHELEEARDQFPKDYYDRFQAIIIGLDSAYSGLELIEVPPSLPDRQKKAAKHGRRIKVERELNKIGLSLLHSPFRSEAK